MYCGETPAQSKIEVSSTQDMQLRAGLFTPVTQNDWSASLVNVVSFPSSFQGKVLLLYEAMKSTEACPHPCETLLCFMGSPWQ